MGLTHYMKTTGCIVLAHLAKGKVSLYRGAASSVRRPSVNFFL